jgi:hypothetical protein
MEYIFEVDIVTDGDFHFPYIPCDMRYYPTNGTYSLKKSYDDKESAIKNVTDICAFLKEQMDTDREWVREMFNNCVDIFVRDLHEEDITSYTHIYEEMNGNYSGTEFIFHVNPNRYDFSLNLTDEEFELIRKNGKLVSIGQVKNAVLDLFRQ